MGQLICLFFVLAFCQIHRLFVGDVMKINIKKLVISILLPLFVGFLASFLIKEQLDLYDVLLKPAFAPFKAVFPIVWSILYLLMGVSFYFIWNDEKKNMDAIVAYGLQLVFNFFWPILFFNARLLFISFVWILLLVIVIVDMIFIFYKENKLSAILLVPYLAWCVFACYLNGAIYLLN